MDDAGGQRPRDPLPEEPRSPLAPPPRRRGLRGDPAIAAVLAVLVLAVVGFVVVLLVG